MDYCILTSENIIENIIICDDDIIAKQFNAVPSYDGAAIGDIYSPPYIPTIEERISALEANETPFDSGTYIGTGQYGESSPNIIQPKISAKMLIVAKDNENTLILTREEASNEAFSWYRSTAIEQCNIKDAVYNWIAIS